MSNRYGPWATMIDLGSNPRLSTFWRRRLTMLAATSQTSLALSRRNLLFLGAAALLLMAAPTVRFASAAADGDKSTESDRPSAVKQPGQKPATAKGAAETTGRVSSYVGTTIVGTAAISDADAYLPLLAYHDLNDEVTRKAIGLTDGQVKQLHDIARDFLHRERAAAVEMRKSMESLAAEERAAAMREFQAKSSQRKKSLRQRVESLLTTEQLNSLKAVAVGSWGAGRLLYDPQLDNEIGLRDRQKEQLRRRLVEDDAAKARARQLDEALKKNREKTLAVIAPKQWDEMGAAGGESDTQFPGQELSALSNPVVGEALELTSEQETKVAAIFADSVKRSQELAMLVDKINGPYPAKERAATDAELQRQLRETRKHDREQIAAVLSKRQLALLKKLAVQQQFMQSLLGEAGERSAILDCIHATAEQRGTLRPLVREAMTLVQQFYRERGEAALAILTPEQRDQLIDALDRPPEPPSPQQPGKGTDKRGTLRKVVVGASTVTGPDETEPNGAAKGGKPNAPAAKNRDGSTAPGVGE